MTAMRLSVNTLFTIFFLSVQKRMSVSLIHVRMEELVWMAFTVSPACALLFMPDKDVKVLKRRI